MPLKGIILFFLIFSCTISFAQGNFTLPNSDSDKIRFQLINNLIVIPVEVNGVKLSFLLDSGVSKPLLFNAVYVSDSLQINNVETTYLNGLGAEGAVEALKSKGNEVRIGNAVNLDLELYVIFDEDINFAPRLGIPIHGIIGYDLFRDFIIELNYGSKYLKLHNPKNYNYKKCSNCGTFDLVLSNKKPYIDGSITISSMSIPVKLLIDSGGSDALWLFENKEKGIVPLDGHYFDDYLGKGLSGSVYGKRSKIKSFSLQEFEFNDVNVAFPDASSISTATRFKDRNGSISGELLKRFNMIVDYPNQKITLKKNRNFKAYFHYNKSGIILEEHGVRIVKELTDNAIYRSDQSNSETIAFEFKETYKYIFKPAFTIVELRKGSPAENAGLLIDDVILSINNKNSDNIKMHQINSLFSEESGKLIRLKIDRNGTEMNFQFRLEDLY